MKKKKAVLHFKKSKIANLNLNAVRGGGPTDDFTDPNAQSKPVNVCCESKDIQSCPHTETFEKSTPQNPCPVGTVECPRQGNGGSNHGVAGNGGSV